MRQMKKSRKMLLGIIVVVAVLAAGAAVVLAGKGNETPSGPHYNLNIIGMDKAKNPNMDCGDGHRIFVQLGGGKKGRLTTRILLQPGDFAVIDCNGTDGEAKFQLPNPDPTNSGTTLYSVYIRLRGKPGGDIIMDTCATDPLTGEELCSDYKVVKVRETGKGKNKFENVSQELLYVYAWVCVDYDNVNKECVEYEYMRVPLFSDLLEDYLWRYDNNGVRLAQLRFYEVPTTVDDPIPPE